MEANQPEPLQLLQMADASWPTGGFAFSNGLEAFVQLGQVSDVESFLIYLESYLIQLSEADLAFMNSAFEVNNEEFETTLSDILMDWHAFNLVETMRRGNIISGESWFRLIASVYSPEGIDRLHSFFKVEYRPIYFTIVFPLLLKMIGFDLIAIHRLFYHMALRDQINAGIRLGLLGPELAQKIHFRFIGLCERLRENNKNRKYYEACRSQPILELAQGSHQYLYSRLFQN